jgi:hypothetical protein
VKSFTALAAQAGELINPLPTEPIAAIVDTNATAAEAASFAAFDTRSD